MLLPVDARYRGLCASRPRLVALGDVGLPFVGVGGGRWQVGDVKVIYFVAFGLYCRGVGGGDFSPRDGVGVYSWW